ncbi:MAG: FAD:protein FMN transferase [Elusimicrobiota bacterium]|nr:FAD:protein FMN transferase [Elusimicrobiota bacterium]
MHIKTTVLLVSALALFAAGCSRRGSTASYTQKAFIMNVPAQFRVYGPDTPGAKALADEIFAEWNRISEEFSYSDAYSITSVVNKKANTEWVPVTDEFMRLLLLGLDYYRLTEGAFDITFAPLWPLWKDAASSKKLPGKEDIEDALKSIGSKYIEVDTARKMVKFSKPVEINMGGLLRCYCFERAYKILKERAPSYPVQLRLGGNTLVYGKRPWKYRVPDPLNKGKNLGMFAFEEGMVIASSGRDVFVEIEGKYYSHILDLRTGYPIKDFSNLAIYYPGIENENFLASAALAVMGREKAFKLLGSVKGSAAVWIDGSGKTSFQFNDASKAKWEEDRNFMDRLLDR